MRVHANDSNEWMLASKFKNIEMGCEEQGFPDTATSCNCLPCKHQLRSHQFCRQRIPKSLWQRWSPSSTWQKKIGDYDLAWISASSSSRKLHLRLGRRLKLRLIDNSYKLPLRYCCHCDYSRRMWILSNKVQSDEHLSSSYGRKAVNR